MWKSKAKTRALDEHLSEGRKKIEKAQDVKNEIEAKYKEQIEFYENNLNDLVNNYQFLKRMQVNKLNQKLDNLLKKAPNITPDDVIKEFNLSEKRNPNNPQTETELNEAANNLAKTLNNESFKIGREKTKQIENCDTEINKAETEISAIKRQLDINNNKESKIKAENDNYKIYSEYNNEEFDPKKETILISKENKAKSTQNNASFAKF